jgi:hypothetical protein
MDARKATAALSAAGFILIAGCGGGGKMGGTSLPGTQNGLHNNNQPANSSKVALKFTMPARSATGWTTPAYQPAYKQRRAKAFTPKKTRTSSLRRKPQYISEAVNGGSISIFVYQGSSLALTQGPFTAGTTYGTSDFYCAYVPAAGQYQCSNYSNVFAPLGTDSFYVAMYDSANHLLSVTPGMPGTNFISATQPTYTITSSGYASPIAIQTYGVAASLAIDAPTSCIDPSGSPLLAEGFIADAAGYPISGYLANPVTISMTGNFALYNSYAQPVTTPYTIRNLYGAFSEFLFVAPSSGSAGAVSVSATAGSVGINLTPSTSRNLYAVDRLALSPSTSGINVVGLVDSGPGAYNCGALPMANYSSGTPIVSFSNPVAIGSDDYVPGAGVLDNVSGTPYLTLVDVDRFAFGAFLETGGIINASPAVPIQLAGHNPLALAVSPSEGVASGTIYILNADGSIQTVNDNNFPSVTTATLEPAGTVTGPVDISVFWNASGEFDGDYVFATSSNSANIFEISDASSDPSLTTDNLTGQQGLITPTTYAVSADNLDGYGYLAFIAFDSGNGGAQSLFTCIAESCFGAGNTVFSYSSALAKGQATFSYSGGNATSLVASGSNVAALEPFPFSNPAPTTAPFPSFGAQVTQVITTYDGIWNAVGASSTFKFFYNLSSTSSGSLAGTYATIISPDI